MKKFNSSMMSHYFSPKPEVVVNDIQYVKYKNLKLNDSLSLISNVANIFSSFKGVGPRCRNLVPFDPPQNNSRAVVKNLRILVYTFSLRLTIRYLILKILTPQHQVLSQF